MNWANHRHGLVGVSFVNGFFLYTPFTSEPENPLG